MEIWRNAPGFEGYQVSNEGNVKSLDYNHTGMEKLLKPSVDGGDYLFVRLYKDRKRKNIKIHKLVAQAFLPNPHGYTEVNHKDENKTNNRVENLEWCTHEYNCNYGTHNQRVAEALSKPVYQRTLNRTLVKIWESTAECGRNGFSSGNVSACCNNKYLREGNNVYKDYIWEYED